MAEVGLYPAYIARDEEREIIAAAERVRKTRQSRVVLLYGAGGVGKTRLARALAERQAMVGQATWLEPIDVDDPEYWLLANLQGNIARQLDPANDYFGQYLTYIALLPAHSGEHVTAETVVSRLGHIRRIFLECYAAYVKATAKPVVIIFDTVRDYSRDGVPGHAHTVDEISARYAIHPVGSTDAYRQPQRSKRSHRERTNGPTSANAGDHGTTRGVQQGGSRAVPVGEQRGRGAHGRGKDKAYSTN